MALSALSAGSLAFAPPTALPARVESSRAAALTMGVETELGAVGPLGYWDPLGLVTPPTTRVCLPARPSPVCLRVMCGLMGTLYR